LFPLPKYAEKNTIPTEMLEAIFSASSKYTTGSRVSPRMLNIPVAIHLEQMDREDFYQTALSSLSDSSFLSAMESHRGRGRNDYPIELLWRGLLGSIAFKVSSIEEMRRKMEERPDLFTKIPTSFSFSRFFTFLCRFSDEIEALVVRNGLQLHPDFGQVMALGELEGIHFLWEPQFGLPLFFQIAQPNETSSQTAERLIERVHSRYPIFFQRAKYLLGNSSYDHLSQMSWERFKLRAIIPFKESSKMLRSYRDAFYDGQGMVYCNVEGDMRAMIYAGFEESRNALKYRCLVRHYATKCEKFDTCSLRSGIRIPLSLDQRIFTPLPRTSYRWGQIYRLYDALPLVQKMLGSYLRLANSDSKKVLCCQLASLLLIAASEKINLELKKSEKSSSAPL